MTEEQAKARPINTVLSGPAASVIGALAMTKFKDALILDMGGTTTDIAEAVDGGVRIIDEGARVDRWSTRVKAVDISTFGLGGDSRIYLDAKGRVVIGSERVIPLCLAGDSYPELIRELRGFRRTGELKKYFANETDCYLYTGAVIEDSLTDIEKIAVDCVRERPHSLSYISEKTGFDPEVINLDNLVRAGILTRISLTPTDVLHYTGKYLRWNDKISKAGIEILANRKEVNGSLLADEIIRLISTKLAILCLQSIADFENENVDFMESRDARYLIDRAFGLKSSSIMRPKISFRKPLIAIGAPAEAWVSSIKNLFDVEIIIPENADVANAYGAAVGQICETAEIRISCIKGGYALHTPWSRNVYDTREEAMFYAVHEGRKHIEHKFMDAGCRRWNIEETVKDNYSDTDEDTVKYLGTVMIIAGTGYLI